MKPTRLAAFLVLSFIGLGLAAPANAAPPILQNLNLSQAQTAIDTFTAETSFRALEPASAYGKVWGISGGLIGGVTSADKLASEIHTPDLKALPTGDIFLGVQAPFGIAAEAGFLPGGLIKVNGLKISKFGGNVKWTINEVFFKTLPFDVAVRGGFSTLKVSYDQTVGPATGNISLKSSVYDGSLSLSKRFLFVFEPYAGIGYVSRTATLSATGSIPLLNFSSNLYSIEDTKGAALFFGGLQLRLPLLTITGQYDSMFGINTASVKFAFKI